MKKNDINKFVLKHIQQIKPFDPAEPLDSMAAKVGVEPEKIIRLNANENPYGPSPMVNETIKSLQANIYPDPEQNAIRTELSKFTKMPKETILCGAGSDELIDLLFRLFCTPNNNVIECDPTFGMYSFCARITGTSIISVPRDDNFELDINAVKSAITPETRIIFINSPNNPTGNLAQQKDIEILLETGLIVVIDEAYYEFTDKSFAPLVLTHNNLIVLRTMSKWAGLAGLRIGYGFFNQDLVEQLLKIKQPYNVNSAAELALMASLKDVDYLMNNVKLIVKERSRLYSALQEFGSYIKPLPSEGNYILCESLKVPSSKVVQGLVGKAIFVRQFSHPKLNNYFRISIGKPHHTDAIISALKEIL
ncbi:MAG: histidinol-phosphate transaminase [SAR202 cluster bacterium]|nr:histidinol-phosphate transaminase [SAR202 cluster bacterium]|tara:strand:+ start:5578 stop:6669 length:1092 start_codon:yes stop_codon:yes gene_type:complete